MPRNPGTGVYTKPSPDVITGTTIESTVYNTFVGDVETDLNTPRPVSSGGTGATSADGALANVSGEKAAQLVTSYDTHLWMPGSVRSAAAAAGAPNSTSSFSGIAYINEALANPPTNQNVVVEARDMDSPVKPGLLYTRQKTAGVWSAWNYAGTGDDQTAARSAIYAAPFDAMAYNGMQINGSMEVSQQLGTTGSTSPGSYPADGWRLLYAGAMVLQANISPTYFSGWKNQLGVTINTAQSSIGASDYAVIQQSIEGWRTVRLVWGTSAAQPITIGFWSGHTRVGVYSVSVCNASGGRSYVATYTHNVSTSPQFNVITIPGDTGGLWNAENTTGLTIIFTMAGGPAFTAPSANTWHGANYFAAPGQVNGVASTSGDGFRITGLVVLPGTQAPAAAQSPLIMRPYDQELVTCQRYFYTMTDGSMGAALGTGHFYSTAQLNLPVQFPVQMRAAPTLGTVSGTNYFTVSRYGGTENFGSFVAANLNTKSALIYTGGMTGIAGQSGWILANNTLARVFFDARL